MMDAPYIPTPEQITLECEAIQKTWTAADRRNRRWCSRRDGEPHNFPYQEMSTHDQRRRWLPEQSDKIYEGDILE